MKKSRAQPSFNAAILTPDFILKTRPAQTWPYKKTRGGSIHVVLYPVENLVNV